MRGFHACQQGRAAYRRQSTVSPLRTTLAPSRTELHSLLRQAAWAQGLAADQLQRVERESRERHFPAGAIVCREGEPADHWIGVIEGMVKVDTVARDGRSTTFAGVCAGGWLGEGSLLKRECRPYEVVAMRDSRIALIPQATFDWLYLNSLPFCHFLVRQLNARLGQFISLVESCRMQTSAGQVAVCLAELVNPMLSPAPSGVLRISQEEIARLCGLSRPVTNRALHQLQDAGFVRVHYGSICVDDVPGLHAFAKNSERSGKVLAH
jgi:CRP/FNR family transcriptional regulator, cyclic AMP receptor protein